MPHCGLPQPPGGIIGKALADDPPATCPAGTLKSFVSFVLAHSGHSGFSAELRTRTSTFASQASQ